MVERSKHRGLSPEDRKLFSHDYLEKLRKAVADYSYLLSQGYAEKPALKVVGDHYQLHQRQRMAVTRAACAADALIHRREKCVCIPSLQDEVLEIDGFNVLITLETYLSGGIVVRCLDGCFRDLSSVHRTYELVSETTFAIREFITLFARIGVCSSRWFFDKPVSNSGRLKDLVASIAEEMGHNALTFTSDDPDRKLAASPQIVVTSDSWILDRASRWTNLFPEIIGKVTRENVSIVDLSYSY